MGQTLTCNPPRFGGSPAALRYRWVFNSKTISTRQTAVATKAMVGHSVGCEVIARNAGGVFKDFSPKVGRLPPPASCKEISGCGWTRRLSQTQTICKACLARIGLAQEKKRDP